MTAETITLVLPRDRPFHGVARLVVGGLAARLDFPYEHLEDLQLALASVLERAGGGEDEDVRVELTVDDGGVELVIGPMLRDVEAELREEGDGIGLGRLLAAVVEEVELVSRDGSPWLRLEKRVPVHPSGR